MIAIPLGRGAIVAPSLGVQAMAAVAGLAFTILFIAMDGDTAFGWGAFASAVVGLLAVTAGAARLISDERPVSPLGPSAEETEALLAGIEVGMFATVALLTLPVAWGVLTVTE
jgi:hypothetical protein